MSDDDRALLPFGDDEGAGRLIRRQWHEGRWFFSVVDVIAVLTDSPNPRNYWSMLQRRLRDEGAAEVYTNCWMGSEELAANWFRATQAEAKLRREGISDKLDANRTHFAVGRKVRQTIADLGGTPPEQLPTPAESIAQLQRQERQRIEAQRQPLLPFPADADADTPGDE